MGRDRRWLEKSIGKLTAAGSVTDTGDYHGQRVTLNEIEEQDSERDRGGRLGIGDWGLEIGDWRLLIDKFSCTNH